MGFYDWQRSQVDTGLSSCASRWGVAMAASSGQFDPGGVRVFSGEDEDGKEYRRWKVWVTNKLLTLAEKIPKDARGAYVYTMLSGRALEAVEHLEPTEYRCPDGEAKIFQLLDVRFPTKDSADELSENMTKIFELKANEGESLKMWISRAGEAFELLKRKTNVSFPEEARGWMILNRSGLTAEQRAVVLARSLGRLTREEIGKAMRSCYPDYVVPKKKTFGAGVVVDELHSEDPGEEDPSIDFDDVELFLAEGDDEGISEMNQDPFEESEVKEILATTWQEKRRSLNQLQKSRRFHDAGQVKRQFRVEVEELKRRTRCHRCQQIGHWSRECKNPPVKGSSKGSKGKSSGKADSGAAMVEHFVALVSNHKTMSQLLLEKRSMSGQLSPHFQEVEQLLVSSPGFGVLDSGCGKTIIGSNTFREFQHLWEQHGFELPQPEAEVNHFRFGNGSRETSHQVVSMPVVLAGRRGFIKAALVQGSAPLLISREAMRTLKAQIDFGRSEMKIFEEELVVPLRTNSAGQFAVYLLGQSEKSELHFEEVMQTEIRCDVQAQDSVDVQDSHGELQPCAEETTLSSELPDVPTPPVLGSEEPDASEVQGQSLSVWSRIDEGLKYAPITGKQGPCWHQIIRRKITNLDNGEVIKDEQIDHTVPKTQYYVSLPHHVKRFQTDFHFRAQEKIQPTECLPVHHLRQVESAVKRASHAPGTFIGGKRFLVAEVFSPPRLAPVARSLGFAAKSYDLENGFDFRKASHRDQVKAELKQSPPDLLLVCPPCTHEGGWWHLNSAHMTMSERAQKQRESRLYIRFCCELYEQQVAMGRMALFEHPKGAQTWNYPEVKKLMLGSHLIKCHMCRFGLKLPHSSRFIRKSTNLLVSHDHMRSLGLECPGRNDPKHETHDVVAGHDSAVGSVSRFAGRYTAEFVEAVLLQVPQFARAREQSLVHVVDEDVHHPQVSDCLAAQREDLQSEHDETVLRAIAKLHKNLGHPSNADLVRILKHGQASDAALDAARKFSCEFCKSQVRPHVPLPAQSSRVTQFNQLIGVDVKYLPGWKPGQKVKALNIVDQSSCYQQMIPFFEQETSSLLQKLLADYWVRWAGPPDSVILDQAQTQVGENFQGYLESIGSSVKFIPAEAHWQLGRTENHGGWFSRILDKIIQEHSPRNKEEWEQCVQIAHVKNQSIQSYGYTPHQHVFGKNPTLPGDLLSEPLHVIAGTAGLSDDAIAKAQAIRCTARQAVVAMQDDKALRLALSARPRVTESFQPGDLVAYWRQQKYSQAQSTVVQGGRWHGVAVVIGNVGRNVMVAHRRQILRCAPEQIRYATTEERTVVESPESELLGIKDMIEGGTFRSKQYIDLVSGHYPTQALEQSGGSPKDDEHVTERSDVPANANASPSDAVPPAVPSEEPAPNPMEVDKSPMPDASGHPARPTVLQSDDSGQTYGPIRWRVHGKAGEPAMFRPPKMKESDFVELMKEIVPQLLELFPVVHRLLPLQQCPRELKESSCHRQTMFLLSLLCLVPSPQTLATVCALSRCMTAFWWMKS